MSSRTSMYNKNDKEIFVSVIVPVYNSAETIDRCLLSICNQQYGKLEIIVVDDGSTDNSTKIISKYLDGAPTVSLIKQENSGSFNARCTGIQHARGKYIAFVDSDDWIDGSMISNLVKHMEDCDLLSSGFFRDARIVTDHLSEGMHYVDNEDFWKNYLISESDYEDGIIGGLTNALWCKLFKRELCLKVINKRLDVSAKINEDFYFLLLYLCECKKIKVTYESYYHYINNPNSITQKVYFDFLRDYTEIFYSIIDKTKGYEFADVIRKNLIRRFLYEISVWGTQYMGAGIIDYSKVFQLSFPNLDSLNNKNVVLYCEKEVWSCFDYISENHRDINVVAIISSSLNVDTYFGIPVVNLQELSRISCDFIVLTMGDEDLANEATKELCQMGIEDNKILRRPPILKNLLAEILLSDA
ncbi:Glycosyltransferase involved in cell wall bisynthesis [Butyrivibrio sp. ob235]|uniref:glycosyltransferase family 2 protein n=1 Tax=Butyrivibrio sp. ob235 TaxID=1761780 RepID=UPI0008C99416|nr:glycosyltransferase family 2 protein [Butyrivibrio sp. ob235]SEL97540.1 Glycosyltransferase involved in cell wall bisynthesis [Butyrivibrio sp. ob235]